MKNRSWEGSDYTKPNEQESKVPDKTPKAQLEEQLGCRTSAAVKIRNEEAK